MSWKSKLKRIPGASKTIQLARRAEAVFAGVRQRSAARRAVEKVVVPSPNREQWFVGYYDHSPFKPNDESLLLVHATRHPAWRTPSPRVPVSILLVDWRTGHKVKELGHSFAWNWQQGARALWFDQETAIFNVYDDKRDAYCARLVGVDGKVQGQLPVPVQEVDCRGRVYSFSYEALTRIRPDYGYRNRPPAARSLEENAIEVFDPATNAHQVLLPISELQEDAGRRHGVTVTRAKFNHLMASPDARRLAFLFRYFVHDRRVTDLYFLDMRSGKPILSVSDAGVSHACWWGEESLLATMNGSSGFGYYRVFVDGGEPELVWRYSDGHPGYLGDTRFLTDTYPDHHGLRHLLIRSVSGDMHKEVAAFPEPLLFLGEKRCDLHPSVSSSGRWLQVDCALGHRRCVAVLPNPESALAWCGPSFHDT